MCSNLKIIVLYIIMYNLYIYDIMCKICFNYKRIKNKNNFNMQNIQTTQNNQYVLQQNNFTTEKSTRLIIFCHSVMIVFLNVFIVQYEKCRRYDIFLIIMIFFFASKKKKKVFLQCKVSSFQSGFLKVSSSSKSQNTKSEMWYPEKKKKLCEESQSDFCLFPNHCAFLLSSL